MGNWDQSHRDYNNNKYYNENPRRSRSAGRYLSEQPKNVNNNKAYVQKQTKKNAKATVKSEKPQENLNNNNAASNKVQETKSTICEKKNDSNVYVPPQRRSNK